MEQTLIEKLWFHGLDGDVVNKLIKIASVDQDAYDLVQMCILEDDDEEREKIIEEVNGIVSTYDRYHAGINYKE